MKNLTTRLQSISAVYLRVWILVLCSCVLFLQNRIFIREERLVLYTLIQSLALFFVFKKVFIIKNFWVDGNRLKVFLYKSFILFCFTNFILNIVCLQGSFYPASSYIELKDQTDITQNFLPSLELVYSVKLTIYESFMWFLERVQIFQTFSVFTEISLNSPDSPNSVFSPGVGEKMDVIMHVDNDNKPISVKVERHKLPDSVVSSTPKEKVDYIIHVDEDNKPISVKVEKYTSGKGDISTPKGDDIYWPPGWPFGSFSSQFRLQPNSSGTNHGNNNVPINSGLNTIIDNPNHNPFGIVQAVKQLNVPFPTRNGDIFISDDDLILLKGAYKAIKSSLSDDIPLETLRMWWNSLPSSVRQMILDEIHNFKQDHGIIPTKSPSSEGEVSSKKSDYLSVDNSSVSSATKVSSKESHYSDDTYYSDVSSNFQGDWPTGDAATIAINKVTDPEAKRVQEILQVELRASLQDQLANPINAQESDSNNLSDL